MVEANDVFEKDTHVFIGHGWNVKKKYFYIPRRSNINIVMLSKERPLIEDFIYERHLKLLSLIENKVLTSKDYLYNLYRRGKEMSNQQFCIYNDTDNRTVPDLLLTTNKMNNEDILYLCVNADNSVNNLTGTTRNLLFVSDLVEDIIQQREGTADFTLFLYNCRNRLDEEQVEGINSVFGKLFYNTFIRFLNNHNVELYDGSESTTRENNLLVLSARDYVYYELEEERDKRLSLERDEVMCNNMSGRSDPARPKLKLLKKTVPVASGKRKSRKTKRKSN